MGTAPRLNSLYYHITNRCNLRCVHCWVEAKPGAAPELTREEAEDIIRQGIPLGLRTMKFTGGEPFLVPHTIDLAEFAHERGLRRITFETNGTLITPDLARRLVAIRAVVAISIDGSTAKVHERIRGVKGCFEAAVTGIRNLIAAGLTPDVLTAVNRSNYEDIPDLVQFLAGIGVKDLKFNAMTPTGRAVRLAREGQLLSLEEQRELFYSLDELSRLSSLSISMSFPPLLCKSSKMRRHMCAACDVLHVLGLLPDGKAAMCGIGHTDSRLVYGDLRQVSLRELWEENPPQILQELRAQDFLELDGVCRTCMFKSYCRGSCRALSFVAYGRIQAPYPACQEAWDAGEVAQDRLVRA